MVRSQQNTPRKPATKFAQLRKRLESVKRMENVRRTQGIHQVQRGQPFRHK